MAITHETAKTNYISVGDVQYAYRSFGNDTITKVPLMFFIHFRGTMDYWDPLLINSVAAKRPVLLFDNAGVGQSTGVVPTTIKGMAEHAIILLKALRIEKVDVLGFSMGGGIAPLVYLLAPKGLVRRIIVAGSGPSAGEGVLNNTEERGKEVGRLAGQANALYDDGFDKLFFGPSASSQEAGRKWWKRINNRNSSTSGEERSQLVSFGYADGGVGIKNMIAANEAWKDPAHRDEGNFDRLGEVDVPVFIAQGKDDFMIPTVNSFVMQQKLSDARLKVFPDSGHGFLYQFAEEFARDVNNFLDL
ncbi:Alpha/Beta hydrolase protein [Tricladium varicosporioides]|nr:Alpha/Beta hydrolase protein [Hymenoscyphus varicosporioides]